MGINNSITPRLLAIKNLVSSNICADIGTDHAYIPISLIEDNVCDRVIASDVNIGPLSAAKTNIEKYGFSDRIETRLGNGLSVLEKSEADQIIIAGMGGFIISEIIKANKEVASASELILQPMNCQYELRKYLSENEFCVKQEELALEGFKIYNILRVVKGNQAYDSEIDMHLPKSLYSHPLFSHLYEKKMREFNKILNGQKCSQDSNEEIIEKYTELIKSAKIINKS